MTTQNEKILAIVIPVFNNWLYTQKALKHLQKLPDNHLVIVVDNGSEDQTKRLRSVPCREVIHNQVNLGFAKACNIGYARAVELGYENVMFLNNDIKIIERHENWTYPLIGRARGGEIVGPTAGVLDEHLNFVCETSKWPTKGYAYLSGWNITSSVKVWDHLVQEGEIGPFSTNFFAYFEDTDLSFRANVMGLKQSIVSVPVRHIGRVTGKKLGLSNLYSQSRKTFLKLWESRTGELKILKD
jgi:GT2 family glycosyltransferase